MKKMRKLVSILCAMVMVLVWAAPAFAASNNMQEFKNPNYNKVVITTSEEERDRQFNDAMETIIKELEGTPQTRDNKERFQYEYFDYEYVTLEGYAGNQVPGGYRFPSGGGFFFSDSGGPDVSGSISLSLPAPYDVISFSVNLGQKTASFGEIVYAPNTTDYFKLYVEKLMEIRPYAIYKQNPDTREYEFYKAGAVSLTFSVSPYAKKV